MKLFNRVTIIGLGLIGGSLAIAIKKKKLAGEVVGVSRRKTTIDRARTLGIVDSATLDLKKGVKDSDLVILTAPVLKIIDIAKKILPCLKKGAILTDAGSTKEVIVKSVEGCLPAGISFLGSHPLAGSERSGLDHIDKDLFKGAHCILTRAGKTNKAALSKLKRFWGKLGMKVEVMSLKKHDKALSALSHLPHAASVALSNACAKKDLRLAAGGFKDTTRIASGKPELWRDIFITNRKNIAKDIDALKKELTKIEKALERNNSAELLRLLRKAKKIRDSI